MSLFDQAVKLSFTSKDGEDDEPDQPDQPCEQNWGKWKKPPPGPGSDSARFAPYILVHILALRSEHRRAFVARAKRIRDLVIWRFLICCGRRQWRPVSFHLCIWAPAVATQFSVLQAPPVATLVISFHFIASFLWAPPVATQFSVLS